MSNLKDIVNTPISIFALGGLGEVGKNMYCVEDNSTLLIIDCGILFPDDSTPGVDYIIPDFSHVIETNKKNVALVITHGHEDHIGGIPFLLKQVDIPFIYAPKLSAALIRRKISDNKIQTNCKVIEYDEDSKIKIGDFYLDCFRVTHSIPDSYGILIKTSQGTILHTGDFKIDLTPTDGSFNISKLSKIADSGVDLLLADSTNAEKEGYTDSELAVTKGINNAFTEAPGRILITTFSSNISRIREIIEIAIKHKRFITIVGRSLESNVEVSRMLGYIKANNSAFKKLEELENIPFNQTCIICTGTQGEELAVLSKISRCEHKNIRIMPGDTVLFSSSVIPGNTASVSKITNALAKQGANVILNCEDYKLHASGHASKQEMRLLQKIVHPRNFMPIHGEYRMLKLHGKIAVECGLSNDNVFICDNGEVLNLLNHNVTKSGFVHSDSVYIDGKNPIGISNNIMKERNNLVFEGMVCISYLLDINNGNILSSPSIKSKGFSSIMSKSFKKKLSEIVFSEVKTYLQKNPKTTFLDLKIATRNAASKYIYREYHRNPVIVPLIFSLSD